MNLIEKLREFESNSKWIDEHYQELREKYPDEYVAVCNRKVADHNPNLIILVDKLKIIYPENYKEIPIEYISKEDYILIPTPFLIGKDL